MADKIAYLGEADYLGATPEQMLALAGNERQMMSEVTDLAKSESARNVQMVKLAQQQQQFQEKQRLKMIQEMLKQANTKRKADLEERRFKVYEQYTKQLSTQSQLASMKSKRELDKMDKDIERFTLLKDTTFKITGYDEPVSAGDIQVMKSMGLPIKFEADPNIDEIVVDKQSGKLVAIMKDASTKPIDKLQASKYRLLRPPATTTIKLDPGTRAEQTAIGRSKAELRSPEYSSQLRERLVESDSTYRRVAFRTDADSLQVKESIEKAEVQKNIEALYGKDFEWTYLPGKGFFSVIEVDGKKVLDKTIAGAL